MHDLKLAGESEVKHQIDVTIEQAGKTKRILIECKDFHVSGDKVGLIDDVRPDAALVLSTDGFTQPARQYAAAKGIGLGILREYTREDDLERIKEIHIRFEFRWAENFRVTFVIPEAADQTRLKADMHAAGMQVLGASRRDPVTVDYEGTSKHILDLADEKLRPTIVGATGDTVTLRLPMPGATLTVGSGSPVPIAGMVLGYDLAMTEELMRIVAEGTVRLILETVGGDETLIFDEDLKSVKIDDKGKVSKKL